MFDRFNQNKTITYTQISVDIYSYESEHKMLIIRCEKRVRLPDDCNRFRQTYQETIISLKCLKQWAKINRL